MKLPAKLAAMGLALLAVVAVACTDDAESSDPDAATATGAGRVRVVHMSPDAPAVDILVNGEPAITNLAFPNASSYAELPQGSYNVGVTPAGQNGTVVLSAELPVVADGDATVVAVGRLSELSVMALADDNATPAPGNARVRFVHASPDAPAVDIAVAGGPVLFPNVAFQGVGDYAEVPAGSYDLEVRVAGTSTVALPLPGVVLNDGQIVTVFAAGLLADNSLTAVPVVYAEGIPAAAAAAPAQSTSQFEQATGRVRVVHMSPDAPAVDVVVNGAPAIPNLAFPDASDYATLPAATYDVAVTPAGQNSTVVIGAALPVQANVDATVVAVGRLSEIDLLVLGDNNSTPAPGNAKVRFVHASPDAPAVDIAVAGGPVLFPNVAFKGVGEYAEVAAGTYDLEVRVAGTHTVALSLPGVTLSNGQIVTVFAAGLLEDGSLTAVPVAYTDR